MEQSVATPIEAQVNGAKNMIYMQSINGNDGTMTLQVSFEVGTNVDLDQVQVQNRLAQATASLPSDVNNYGLTTQQTVGIPLLVFTINSPKHTWDQNFLSNYVAINIKDELARIPGIGQVKVFGASNYAMRVWVAPDILSKLQLTVGDLENAISAQNVVNPAGQIGGAPAPAGQQTTYSVTAQGRLMTAEQFGDIIIRANPDGSLVRLKDVARIELGTESYTQQASTNGLPSAIVGLYQNPGLQRSGGRESGQGEDGRTRAPFSFRHAGRADSRYHGSDNGRRARNRQDAARSHLAGHPGRVHFPAELARHTHSDAHDSRSRWSARLCSFRRSGFTINTLALLGLVLAVGLVVDDAIVVVEAIEAKIEQGRSPRDAAFEAMDEISGALVGIALVLAAVFIPAAFMAGITGSLYKQFALTIAFSVLLSALNALTLSPALAAMLLRPRESGGGRGPLGRFFNGFNAAFDRVQRGYVGACNLLGP